MFNMFMKIGCILIFATAVLAVSKPTSEATVTAERSSAEPFSDAVEPTTTGEKERATVAEIVTPPFVLIAIIISGLGVLMASSKLRRRTKRIERRVHQQFLNRKSVKSFICLRNSVRSTENGKSGQTSVDAIKLKIMDMQAFFAESDIDAIDSLYSFFNQPVPLIIIALPALISLAFCPLVLFMYKPMVEFFWPANLFPSGPPNINEAISCFLAPAGLVYATSFGFSFQGAMQKQRALLNNISLEVALLDQVIILASNLNNATCKERLQIYRIIKEEAVSIILQIQGKVKYSSNDYKSDRSSGQVWKILTLLHRATTRDRRWNMDQIIMAKMLAHIMQLNTACSDRDETLQAIIHPLKWIFLECLGFFSFFGVLLLQTQSYRMELAMCIITVFSISLLCYVVADFDSPFNGFFKVNLAALIEIIDKAEDMYLLTLEGKDPYQMRAKQTICSTNPNASDDNDDVVEEDLLKV